MLLLLGGKKKKTSPSTSAEDETEDETEGESTDADEGEADEGEGIEYGKVANGKRQDKLGTRNWRIMFEEDGYHAQIMMGAQVSAAMQEEVGITASLTAAKEMLRDYFNQELADAGWPESDFRAAPAASLHPTMPSSPHSLKMS